MKYSGFELPTKGILKIAIAKLNDCIPERLSPIYWMSLKSMFCSYAASYRASLTRVTITSGSQRSESSFQKFWSIVLEKIGF